MAGVAVLAVAAVAARSVALAGFGLDSLIEIRASTVVLWELSESSTRRQAIALKLIGVAFLLLALYLAIQSTVILVLGDQPGRSPVGITWTAATAAVMLLWRRQERTGQALGHPFLRKEGRVTFVDALLATAVLVGLILNAALGWWWADPLAAYVILVYGLREGWEALRA